MDICRSIRKCDKEQERVQKQQRKLAGRENGKVTALQKNETVGQELSQQKENNGQSNPKFGKSVETLLAEAESIRARKEAVKREQNEIHGELSASI